MCVCECVLGFVGVGSWFSLVHTVCLSLASWFVYGFGCENIVCAVV